MIPVAGKSLGRHVCAMHNDETGKLPAKQADPRIAIMEAIARSLLVRARYNDQTMTLAPHALFARRGELFLRALNLTKNWRADEERRLGQFKLDGLRDVVLTEELFEPLPNSGSFTADESEELLLSIA